MIFHKKSINVNIKGGENEKNNSVYKKTYTSTSKNTNIP